MCGGRCPQRFRSNHLADPHYPLVTLVWLVGFVTFFLSAILDNLTTTIVMISLMKKLLDNQSDRLFFAAMIVIAANAGGAWSAIGDVTTTMLWIGGQITPLRSSRGFSWPHWSICWCPCLSSAYVRGREVVPPPELSAKSPGQHLRTQPNVLPGPWHSGVVPPFKAATHLPPFMGILFGFGVLWMVGELIHRGKGDEEKGHSPWSTP